MEAIKTWLSILILDQFSLLVARRANLAMEATFFFPPSIPGPRLTVDHQAQHLLTYSYHPTHLTLIIN